jgi:Leucine-rich repeat (LRR) protein
MHVFCSWVAGCCVCLEEVDASGNRLEQLPLDLRRLKRLQKLILNDNRSVALDLRLHVLRKPSQRDGLSVSGLLCPFSKS